MAQTKLLTRELALWYVVHLQVHYRVSDLADVFSIARDNQKGCRAGNADFVTFSLDVFAGHRHIGVPEYICREYFKLPEEFRLATV